MKRTFSLRDLMRWFQKKEDGSQTPSITCPWCRMKSYNATDIRYKYCSNCAAFHSDIRREG